MKIYYRVMRGGHHGIVDSVISWYSRAIWTHAEFAWPLTDPNPEYWFGSARGGVKFRDAHWIPHKSYDLFSVDINDGQLTDLQHFLYSQSDKPYDYRAIAGMAFQWLDREGKKPTAWFCSELVFYALSEINIQLLLIPEKESDRITPRDIAISPIANYEGRF